MTQNATPMLASTATELPAGPDWSYEVKWDGYRVLASREGSVLRLTSRHSKDLTAQYPTVAAAVKRLRATRFILDGEIVAIDAHGRPSFQALQHRMSEPHTIAY